MLLKLLFLTSNQKKINFKHPKTNFLHQKR
nr:MAG TPA: hypothetical protein [Caudoviricetes sp.]